MLSTWLFILLVGDAAQVIEVANMHECLQLKQYVADEVDKSETLKDKVALGCFRNLGKRTHVSGR